MKKSYLDIFNQIDEESKLLKTYDKNSRILILDGLNNYIRIWVVMPTMNEDGLHVGGITGFLQTLGLTIRTLKPTRVIVVFDGKGGSVKRRKLYPAYKQNRGHGVRLNRSHDWADDEDEQKQMLYQLGRVVTYLQHLPVTVISIDNIEADDTIAYLATEFCKNNPDVKEAFISSSDKDFYQLVDDKIKIWNPHKKKIITKENLIEEYGIHPNNFLLFKAMDGDMGDNCPGIKGIGRKTAIKHFPFLSEERLYDKTDVLEYAQKHKGDASIYGKLIDNSNQYSRNYDVMRLAGDELTSGAALKIIKKFNEPTPTINLKKIQDLVMDDKVWSTFPNINSWININFSQLNHFATKK